jgi:hypothetical protein
MDENKQTQIIYKGHYMKPFITLFLIFILKIQLLAKNKN